MSKSLLYENENIFITPDISPLIPGHLLVVSQNHYNSFSNASYEVKESLINALNNIKKIPGYDIITWFEHGAIVPGTGGASIDHAHLHILPKRFPIQEIVEKEALFTEKITYSNKIFLKHSETRPYLWIGNELEKSTLYYVDEIPSQYLRKIVMMLLGIDKYDWKDTYYTKESFENYLETLKLIRCEDTSNE